MKQTEYFLGAFSAVRPAILNQHLKFASGKGIKVGVVDSGWDKTLIDDRIKEGINLVDPDDELSLKVSSNFNDTNGHGTSCAELILRIAPEVEIYPIRVFGKRIETSANILIEAIKWAVEKNIKVLNFSLGTLLSEAMEPLYSACEFARRKGIIIISANSNSDEWSYPAIFENSIGVELGNFESIYDFEFRKDEAVECIAKGLHNDILTLSGIRIKSGGNSFAAPVITGLVSLIVEKNPFHNLDDVRKYLRKYSRSKFKKPSKSPGP